MRTSRKNLIKFSSGEPSVDCLSSRLLKQLTMLGKDIPKYYSYAERAGLLSARKLFIELWGTPCSHIDKCLITHGTLGAIELIVRVLKPKVMMVIEPTFADAINIFKSYGISIKAIPLNNDKSINFKQLDNILSGFKKKKMIAGIYLVPTLNNPDGRCLDLVERKKFVNICLKTNTLCIEDEVYREFMYDKSTHPSLFELAGAETNHAICRILSMSKMIMPGLRVAFVEANEKIITSLVENKLDFGYSPIACYVAEKFMGDRDGIRITIDKIRKRLVVNNNYLKQMCRESGIVVNDPVGGYFLWADLGRIDERKLIETAKKLGVDFAPGYIFYADPMFGSIRLCASMLSRPEIKTGVKRLKQAIDIVSATNI